MTVVCNDFYKCDNSAGTSADVCWSDINTSYTCNASRKYLVREKTKNNEGLIYLCMVRAVIRCSDQFLYESEFQTERREDVSV